MNVFQSILFLVLCVLSASGVQGQIRGPLVISPNASKSSPEPSAVSIMLTAGRNISGAAITGRVSPVNYQDASPFGPSGTGGGWAASGISTITNDEDSAQVVLNVLLDSNGLVAAVYTNPNDSWIEPIEESRNPEITTAADGWIMGNKVPESMASTANDAIAAAWKQFGLDPRQVGQVIARPRWISAQFPARRVDDKLVPVRPTEKVWLVEVCGAKFNENDSNGVEHYQTCKVMQFRDGTMEYVRGVFVP
jgi:hypothetical protein